MKNDSVHGKVFLASLSIVLCFVLTFPLISPGLQAYAEEQRSAPPNVTLAAAPTPVTDSSGAGSSDVLPAAVSPDSDSAGASGLGPNPAEAFPASPEQRTANPTGLQTEPSSPPSAVVQGAASLVSPQQINQAASAAKQKETERRKPDLKVSPRPLDGLRASASANMAKGKSPADAKSYTINDEHTVTFTEPDGSYTTTFSEDRIAYKDGQGRMQPIDNTLKAVNPLLSPAYYENADADYTATFPDAMNQPQGISFEKDGGKVELIPIGGDFTNSLVAENAIRYTDVYPGVDFQYTLVSDTIKEDIILNQYVNAPSFGFELKTGGMKTALVDGDICVYKDGQTEPFYTLSSPMMQDASGATSSTIVQSLKEEDGEQVVTVTPDAAWLSDLSRAYPVTIDPTLSLNDASIYLEMVMNENPGSHNTDAQNGGGILCGYDDGYLSGSAPYPFGQTRAYVKFRYDFSRIPVEAKINSATFSLYQLSAYSGGRTFFTLNEVNQNWDQNTITWNNQPLSHTYLDGKNANTGQGYLTFNVRSAVNDWVQGLAPNYGFVMITSPEGSNIQAENFRAVSGLDGDMPTLTMNWSIPDPVPDSTGINDLTISLYPITEKALSGKQQFDGVFGGGPSKADSTVAYTLQPDGAPGSAYAGWSYAYPDSTGWTSTGKVFPNGTKYKDKLSNWQSGLYSGLSFNKEYQIQGSATYDDGFDPAETSSLKKRVQFLIYQV